MFINKKICFVESQSDNIQYTNIDNSFPSDDIYFKKEYKFNIVLNNNCFIKLNAGVFSNDRQNNLIHSDIYKNDEDYIHKGIFLPFKENNEKIYGNKIDAKLNPLIYKKAIGTNYSEDFDDFGTEPYRDIKYLNSNSELINFRYYLNSYFVQNLMQSIDILNVVNSLNGNVIIENIFQGLIVYFSNSDYLNRQNIVIDEIDINENTISGFLDQNNSDDIEESSLIRTKYKYETRVIDGKEYTVFLAGGVDDVSYVSALTSEILFYNEENNYILPFNDSITEEEAQQNIITSARGSDSDASYNESITLTRIGEID